MACEPFPGSHTAKLVSQKILEVSERCGIDTRKITCLITDNEPTMNAVGNLVPFEWMGCIDHLIELVTGVVFSSTGVGDVMARARAIVGYFHHSTQATNILKQLQIAINPLKEALRVECDTSSRWWSTWKLLKRLLELKIPIKSFQLSKQNEFEFDDNDWLICEYIVKALEPFMQIQKYLEGVKYVTIGYIPALVFGMRTSIKTLIDEFQPVEIEEITTEEIGFEKIRAKLHHVANEMNEKFEARWGQGNEGTVFDEHKSYGPNKIRKGLPLVAMLGAVLDPRTKYLIGIPKSEHEFVWKALSDEMVKVVDEQRNISSSLSIISATVMQSDLSKSNIAEKNFFELIMEQKQSCPVNNGNTDQITLELISYKNKCQVPNEVDPLNWWKTFEVELPLLSKVAKKILCIPATSAESERMFSTAGGMAREGRERLDGDTLAALVFLNRNLGAVEDFRVKRERRETNT